MLRAQMRDTSPRARGPAPFAATGARRLRRGKEAPLDGPVARAGIPGRKTRVPQAAPSAQTPPTLPDGASGDPAPGPAWGAPG